MGQFLAAVLNANAISAWRTVAPGATEVVPYVYFNDPLDVFDSSKLPALYLWRSQEFGKGDKRALWQQRVRWQGDRVTDGISLNEGQIEIRWVMDPVQDSSRKTRSPIFACIANEMVRAIRSERDPAWIQDGDESDFSQGNGSSIWTASGWALQPLINLFTPEHLAVTVLDSNNVPLVFASVSGSIRVFERLPLTPTQTESAAYTVSLVTGSDHDQVRAKIESPSSSS